MPADLDGLRLLRRLGLHRFPDRLSGYPGKVWCIEPVKARPGGPVAMQYSQLADGRVVVWAIDNESDERGWGRRMCQALRALHPALGHWSVDSILDSGVHFWVAMQDELAVTLVDLQTRLPVLDEDVAAARIAEIAELGVDEEVEHTSDIPSDLAAPIAA